jgi:hypothetical protein
MKAKPILKRKIYLTWISHDKRTGFIIFVWESESVYHLEIYSGNTAIYSTADDHICFADLDTVFKFAKLWIEDQNCTRSYQII